MSLETLTPLLRNYNEYTKEMWYLTFKVCSKKLIAKRDGMAEVSVSSIDIKRIQMAALETFTREIKKFSRNTKHSHPRYHLMRKAKEALHKEYEKYFKNDEKALPALRLRMDALEISELTKI